MAHITPLHRQRSDRTAARQSLGVGTALSGLQAAIGRRPKLIGGVYVGRKRRSLIQKSGRELDLIRKGHRRPSRAARPMLILLAIGDTDTIRRRCPSDWREL